MDSGTTFRFRGYSGRRSGAAASSLFLDYDGDEDDDYIYDLDSTKSVVPGDMGVGINRSDPHQNSYHQRIDYTPMGVSGKSPALDQAVPYHNPAELCRVQEAEEVAEADDSAGGSEMPQRGASAGESSMCFDVPDAALSSCVWAGSNLLSRMLFQIYNEMGDESKTNTWVPNSFPGSRLQLASRLLTNDMANSLFDFLPETAKLETPSMVFATYRDGWSMENLLAKTRDKAPLVMLIRSLKHSVVFGAFSPTSISPPSKFVRGNGEVFVFRLSPPAAVYRWVRIPSEANKATRNQFIVSTMMFLAFGASEENACNAIRLDSDLQNCSSGYSDTYMNPPLAPEESSADGVDDAVFSIQDIEVLQMGDWRKRHRR